MQVHTLTADLLIEFLVPTGQSATEVEQRMQEFSFIVTRPSQTLRRMRAFYSFFWVFPLGSYLSIRLTVPSWQEWGALGTSILARRGHRCLLSQMIEGKQELQSCRSCGRGGDSGPGRAGELRTLEPWSLRLPMRAGHTKMKALAGGTGWNEPLPAPQIWFSLCSLKPMVHRLKESRNKLSM